MRTNRLLLAAAAGLALGAAAAFARQWRQNYLHDRAVDQLREEIPEDEAGALDLLEHLDDLDEFDAIATFTCMLPCCYTPLDVEQLQEYGLDPFDE